MSTLNQYFITSRIKHLKLNDEDFKKFGMSFDGIFEQIMRKDYSRMFIIKLSIILKCNIIDLFNNPDEKCI